VIDVLLIDVYFELEDLVFLKMITWDLFGIQTSFFIGSVGNWYLNGCIDVRDYYRVIVIGVTGVNGFDIRFIVRLFSGIGNCW
jgi:hypothetical protein